jgi:hypothetical protein
MRRSALFTLAAVFAVFAASPAQMALAQVSGNDKDQQAEDAARKKRDQEWTPRQAPLPSHKNVGPCPYVGEIQGISAACQYIGPAPIKVEFEVLFALGRGPQAQGARKDYAYWVAVTDRNRQVISKEYFNVAADFGHDDRVLERRDHELTIPRANPTVSGGNFEILIGFDVTPEMAAFNRDGKRFRVNATAPATASAPAPQTGGQ